MILDTWQNPAMAQCKRLPVFAYDTPRASGGATLDDILALAGRYRDTMKPLTPIEESVDDTPKLA